MPIASREAFMQDRSPTLLGGAATWGLPGSRRRPRWPASGNRLPRPERQGPSPDRSAGRGTSVGGGDVRATFPGSAIIGAKSNVTVIVPDPARR
jgi:hypothetical protein